MKKVYTAPKAYIEYFEMSEHIAACGDTTVGTGNEFGKPNHYSGSDCEFVLNGGSLIMFLESNNSCTTPTDPNGMEIGCYNTPDGTNSVFAS